MQNRIPEDVIDNIRKGTDIVDLVGEYVDLKKQGRNFFGLCPFHSENTPSFSVTQDKQIFYCFGCKKGGNVFTFLMELESYTFYESITLLADRNSIALPETTKSQEKSISKESQSILSAHDWLRRLYHYLLRYTEDGKAGLDYLKNRGISEEIIDEFQLGFAPDIKNMTADFLDKKGFHQQVLVKAGILNLQKDNNVLDPYRGRLIFPIRNHLGKTIAFGARTITGQEPKYLNSAESELYQKGRILYNFDLAKKHIRKKSEVILFEGQFDVISVYQAGIKNVIATLGTSLTENQAKLLKRYVDTVILCFDTDKAGVKASFKAAELLRQSNCQVKVAHMKEDMDPDSYIRKYGSENFEREVIKASDTYMGFYIRYMKNKYNLSNEGDRISYIQIVLKQLAMIESAIEREHYLRELSNEYNLSVESLKDEMQVYRRKNVIHKDNRVKNRYTKRAPGLTQKRLLPAFQNAERQLLAYMLQDRSVADRVQKDIGVNFNIDEHKIIATHLYAFYEENLEADISLFIEWISDDTLQQLVIEISMISLLDEVSEQEINDYIRMIRSQVKSMGHIKEFRDHQKLAEQQNDPIKAAQIAMRIIQIEKRLKNTK